MYLWLTEVDDLSSDVSLLSVVDSSVLDKLRFSESKVSSLFETALLVLGRGFGIPAVRFFCGVENMELMDPNDCDARNTLILSVERRMDSGICKDFLKSWKIATIAVKISSGCNTLLFYQLHFFPNVLKVLTKSGIFVATLLQIYFCDVQ